MCYSSKEGKNDFEGRAVGPEVELQAIADYSQALKPNGTCPAAFQNYSGPVTPFFPSISPLFGIGMALTLISCLSHHCVLGIDNLFSSFTGPEMERNVALGWIVPRISLIPDLDDEVWNL